MKKYFLLIMLSLSLLPAYAQRFQGGMVLGLTGSQIDGDGYSGYYKPGFELGAFADLVFSPYVSLRSGVFMVQKGAHSSAKQPYFKTVVNEVEVPLWLNYYPYSRIGVSFGTSFSYIFSAYYHSSYYLSREDLGIGNTDIDLYFSLNYKFSSHVTLRAAYRYGIIPITRPIRWECWKQSIYLFWLSAYPGTSTPCWWTNTASFSLEFKIGKQK